MLPLDLASRARDVFLQEKPPFERLPQDGQPPRALIGDRSDGRAVAAAAEV